MIISWALQMRTFIFGIILDLAYTLGPPEISVDDSQKIVFAHLGTSATLRCPVKMNSGIEGSLFVDWKRGDESLYLEDRYRINERGVLKIRAIKINDEGLYTCCATNGYGSVVINVSLVVYGPPDEGEAEDTNNQSLTHPKSLARFYGAPKIELPSRLAYTGEIGSTLTIKCVASGVPYPAIFWLKNGDLQQGTSGRKRAQEKWTSSLNIKVTQQSDAGVYTCVAKNEFGTDQLDFSVHVRDPLSPPTISSLEPPNITVSPGDTAVFWCQVKSNSGLKLHIKWLKSVTNEELQTLNRTFHYRERYYKALESKDVVMTSDGSYKAKLLLSKARHQDSGTYLCLAVNDKGYTFKNATLSVMSLAAGMTKFHVASAPSNSYLVSIAVSVAVTVIAVSVFCFVYKCRTSRNSLQAEVAVIKPEVQPLNDETAQKLAERQKYQNSHLTSTSTVCTAVKTVGGTSYYQIPANMMHDCCSKTSR